MNEPYDIKNIRKIHEDFLTTMSLPSWISNLICPKCQQVIGLSSLREIGLKLNTQHLTNFFIGVCCQYCNYGYELHIENKCKNIKEFIEFLSLDGNHDAIIPDFLINPIQNNLLTAVLKK